MKRRPPQPPARTALTLAGEQGTHLHVACTRCLRRGRYRIARLIAAHGRDHPLPTLLHTISADCPKRGTGQHSDRCGAVFERP